MELKYNVTGSERKALVDAIVQITGMPSKYLKTPTFAYEVGYINIDKHGTVSFDDAVSSEEIENLINQLDKMGFTAETADMVEIVILPVDKDDEHEDETGFSIGFAISEISEKPYSNKTLENLRKIVAGKHSLIKKSIGTTKELNIEYADGSLWFDWFDRYITSDEVECYTQFFKALYRMAENAKRVIAKEKLTENEKYTMRTFLNRLGLSGDEYKPLRKKLLKSLSGDSAFRYGRTE